MKKKSISPKDGAPVMGFYSPGVSVDVGDSTFIFVTGQIARHEDGAPVAPGDFKAQTEFIFQKIEAILHGAGATIDDVVKANIYAMDIKRFKDISDVRNRYFAKAKPASTFIEILGTVREGCEVEIEVIAVKQNEGGLVTIETFVPEVAAEKVRLAMGEAGAGKVGNYSHCSFSVKGIGRYRPEKGAKPAIGKIGKLEEVKEERITMQFERRLIKRVITAIKKAHPYEEVPIFVYPVEEF
ncbi:MAG: hypothetical protein UY50_C0026G0004 [Parcubacteria group bacterium GW2011_GWA2_49_9]|nr:MAG: hypothetical protein UY50_C0026G0004 [Parcubacteria group bacterium GW2011_GWA2_49_9]